MGQAILFIFSNSLTINLVVEECLKCFRLENFYYRVLIIVSGIMDNAEGTVDALSIWLAL